MKDEKLDRETLREAHFRKFEPWIAKACRGTVRIDPVLDAPDPVKPSSLKLYIREAILSHKLNNWNSTLIPVGYNLKVLKVYETKAGMVVIENEYQDKQNSLVKVEEVKTVIIKDGKVVALTIKEKPPIKEANEEIVRGLADESINGFTTIYLVKPEDVEKLSAIYPKRPSCWEPLAEGWWRVM